MTLHRNDIDVDDDDDEFILYLDTRHWSGTIFRCHCLRRPKSPEWRETCKFSPRLEWKIGQFVCRGCRASRGCRGRCPWGDHARKTSPPRLVGIRLRGALHELPANHPRQRARYLSVKQVPYLLSRPPFEFIYGCIAKFIPQYLWIIIIFYYRPLISSRKPLEGVFLCLIAKTNKLFFYTNVGKRFITCITIENGTHRYLQESHNNWP